jgi:hypothetical protein
MIVLVGDADGTVDGGGDGDPAQPTSNDAIASVASPRIIAPTLSPGVRMTRAAVGGSHGAWRGSNHGAADFHRAGAARVERPAHVPARTRRLPCAIGATTRLERRHRRVQERAAFAAGLAHGGGPDTPMSTLE